MPLSLNVFQKMLEDSYKVNYIPDSQQVRHFLEHSNELVEICEDENQWFEEIKKSAVNWLR